jgi:hypothetical protein
MSFEQFAILASLALIAPHVCKEWAFILGALLVGMALMGMLMT